MLTGKGQLSQGNVTVHAVVDKANADALRFDFHSGNESESPGVLPVRTAGIEPGAFQRLSVLEQPAGRFLELT